MGRTYAEKEAVVADLKGMLEDAQLVMVIDYSGLSVSEITELRGRLREKEAFCKVTKNTLMRKAIGDDENWLPMGQFLSGSSAFIVVKDDIGGAVRAYQGFRKDLKKTEFRGGVMQGQALNEDQVKAIADLPSKEELIAQAAGAIKAVATKLAVGINQVPTSVARGIGEVPGSLGRVIGAVAAQKGEGEDS
ncbi:MAG: 50S ribosomal protein L10 [Cyanobacteria bacterium P01_H01_bin.15]